MQHLLIVYHSQTGNTARLAQAAAEGARHEEFAATVSTRLVRAQEAGPNDLLWAHGVLLGTPENFGYMSGGLKDFLDRTFYPVEGRLPPLPYAAFVSAGNDGAGALRAIRRIVGGFPLIEVQEPVVVVGPPGPDDLDRCRELGLALAAGLDAGIY